MTEHVKHGLRSIMRNASAMRNMALGKTTYDPDIATEAMTAAATSCKTLKEIFQIIQKIDSDSEVHNQYQKNLAIEIAKVIGATVTLLKKCQAIVAEEAPASEFDSDFGKLMQHVKGASEVLAKVTWDTGKYDFKLVKLSN